MKLFKCKNCDSLLYFENSVCLKCKHQVGFDANKLEMVTLEENAGGIGYHDIVADNVTYHFCQNAQYQACNWIIPTNDTSPFCLACSLNNTIPDISISANLASWKKIEVAKHRLIYALLRLKLPIVPKQKEGDPEGLAFDFKANTPEEKIITAHDFGLITLNIDEANEADRVQHKLDLGERYRTLLGHFRHEIGHYYWDVLIKDSNRLMAYRQLFGDESRDYDDALKAYYESTPPADWNEHFISIYSTSHPWEDWAETWAHYLHLMDTVETAFFFGIKIDPKETGDDLHVNMWADPYNIYNFDQIIEMWIPLTFAVNSLNRSMGHEDFYPFVISDTIIKKLKFIHETCTARN